MEAALALVRRTPVGDELSLDQGRGRVYVIARYMQTFLLLQPYDEGLLVEPLHGVAGGVLPTIAEPRGAIVQLKQDLLTRREATEFFGREREEGLASLPGNLDQSVFGNAAYPTIESKAAHLLYFVISNLPFSDSNKH